MKLNMIRAILILLLLGVFSLIFVFSNQNAKESTGISMKFSQGIVNLTRKNEPNEAKYKTIKAIEPIIRKLAHFTIYIAVGILSMGLLSTYKLTQAKQKIISLIIGFVYACSDEIHQLFIDGRSGEIRDVLIDTCGVIVGVMICYKVVTIVKKHFEGKIKEQKIEKINTES